MKGIVTRQRGKVLYTFPSQLPHSVGGAGTTRSPHVTQCCDTITAQRRLHSVTNKISSCKFTRQFTNIKLTSGNCKLDRKSQIYTKPDTQQTIVQ